ncbi:MAG: hypothetical protein GY754_27895 [bacterium]|nr:hypothetical protein [bacterium]
MKLFSTIEKGIEKLGVRFIITGLFPSMFFVMFLMGLFTRKAPGAAPLLLELHSWSIALQKEEAVFIGILVLLFALILEPMQFGIIRFLEGYWGNNWAGRLLSKPFVALWKRKRQALEEQGSFLGASKDIPPNERKEKQIAGSKLEKFYPAEGRLLPTSLGNILRAAEDSAGDRYGLDGIVLWPRLYPLLSDKLKALVDDSRNQLDLAGRLCFLFLLLGIISAIVLFCYPQGWLISLVLFLLSWLSYRGAVSAALLYGNLIQTAFDYHRFDLLKTLHLPLPENLLEEIEFNEKLSKFLLQGVPFKMSYDHGKDAAAKKENAPVESGAKSKNKSKSKTNKKAKKKTKSK